MQKEPDEYIDFMFAGNVGTMQSVDTVIKAAAVCKDVGNIRWHIVGDGIDLENCKSLAEKLDVPRDLSRQTADGANASLLLYGRCHADNIKKTILS